MWRWTVILCLLIFYGHTSSQPVTDDSENVRQARQLDFGECCPCPGPGQGFGAQESSMLTGDGMLARARDIDDCPCRGRSSDSEGASSIFLPSSMRADGNFVRPVDRKEDIKPLLHPEVDLASSVLQTLRDATDEEYRDALARDAARSMAKAAEGAIFGDAVPEASNGNIVTIIVNPKHADKLDDVIPQESHVQESRCIHAPLESVSTDLGQTRVAQKPPSLLREIFGLPRIRKPAGLLHTNLLDMDNGASNIQEHVVHVADDQVNYKTTQGLRKFAPLMKIDTNIKDKSTNMKSTVHDVSSIKKVPDFKLPFMKNKLKDLIANRSALVGKEDKLHSLPQIPKISLNNGLSKAKGKDIEDLNLSPSNIHEQAKKSFFQTKSHLENILQKTGPGSLKTLLKLKDVEFVPLKDLIPKATETPNRPKFVWPDIFKKVDSVISSNKDDNQLNEAKSTETLGKVANVHKSEAFDADVSPSNVIEEISDDNCKNTVFKANQIDGESVEVKITPNEIIDTASSPSEVQQTVSRLSKDFSNSQSNESLENTGDCNIKTLIETETNFPKLVESSFENEAQGTNEDELILETSKEVTPGDTKAEEDTESEFVLNDEDCVHNISKIDLITDSSNHLNDVLQPNDTVLENVDDSLVNTNIITEEPCSQELSARDHLNTLDNNPQTKLIKPLDKTLSSIKENILRHIENLKNPKTNSNKFNMIEKESSPTPNENIDSECQNEDSIQVTTVKPDVSNDNLGVENELSNMVSMQDLQKMSDDMLQEELERESENSTCIDPTQEETNPKMQVEVNSVENEDIDSEQSANTQNEVIMDPENVIDIGDKNTNTCQSDLIIPKQPFEQASDADVEASEVVINRIPQSNDIIGSQLLFNKVLEPNENNFNIFNTPLPDIQDIKLAPIPTLDDIKLGLTKLFDKPARDVEENSASEAASMIDTSNVLVPTMSTDASANHFQLKLPPLRLEDVDLDILQLKPQPDLISKIPTLDLHSFKSKLPLPTDFSINPLKLQSAFDGKSSLLGATLSLGQNNPWETIPSLNNFGSRVKANTQKVAKTLRKPDTLRHSLKSSQGIGDLSGSKNTLKSVQQSLESKIRGATIKPVNLQSNDLLETISRNHEDVSDKLRALRVDFNDRLETMRNNIFDKSIFGSAESRSTKSFSTFSNKNKDKKFSLKTTQPSISSRRESKKTLKPRRLLQQRENSLGSSQGLQNKFKMPAAASVPVPRTIEVPELKATLTKSPGLGIQRASSVKPFLPIKDASQAKESTITLWKQASKKLPSTNTRLGKTINSFKDSKIKVSFSTTHRPTVPGRLPSRKLLIPSSHSLTTNLGKNTGRFNQRLDHDGSPSEIKNSIISPPISNDRLIGMDSENKQAGAISDGSTLKLSGRANLEQSKMSKDSLVRVQSWPKVSDSAFLSKVKDAVKARLSHVSYPVTFKQSDVQSVTRPSGENEVLNSNTDMTRSASENIDVIEEQALKENISYKCTMVCTKE